jgi:hypothetical protein
MVFESSGIVKSRTLDDVFWTHNDSGDLARIFAIRRNGVLLKPPLAPVYSGIHLSGSENYDWEDIAIDNSGRLYIGDIGNNSRDREVLTIYRIEEPAPREATSVEVDKTIRVYYPKKKDRSEGRKTVNAEAMFWARDRLFIITKQDGDAFANLHFIDTDDDEKFEKTTEPTPLTRLGSFYFNAPVTAADASPDGNLLAVLTYSSIWVFEAGDDSIDYFNGSIRWLPISAGQCEAICFDDDQLIISNENGRLFRVPMDDLVVLQ